MAMSTIELSQLLAGKVWRSMMAFALLDEPLSEVLIQQIIQQELEALDANDKRSMD